MFGILDLKTKVGVLQYVHIYSKIQKIVWLPIQDGMIQQRYKYTFIQFRLYV